jgi:hypothetical protein
MLLKTINHKTFAFVAVTALAAVSFQTAAYAEGPFARFAGHWRGNGKITLSNGSHESISCRGTYAVGGGGASLTQNLTCASASYKVEVSSTVTAQGNQLSGTWSETTRGVTGSVSGTVSGNTIRAVVNGGSFAAGIGISVSGNSQNVTIRPEGGTDIVGVQVSLRR